MAEVLAESERLLGRSYVQLAAGDRLLQASQQHAAAVSGAFATGGGQVPPWEVYQAAVGIAPAAPGSGLAFVPVQPQPNVVQQWYAAQVPASSAQVRDVAQGGGDVLSVVALSVVALLAVAVAVAAGR